MKKELKYYQRKKKEPLQALLHVSPFAVFFPYTYGQMFAPLGSYCSLCKAHVNLLETHNLFFFSFPLINSI